MQWKNNVTSFMNGFPHCILKEAYQPLDEPCYPVLIEKAHIKHFLPLPIKIALSILEPGE